MAGFIIGVLVFWWLMGWPFWILFAIVGVGAIIFLMGDKESRQKNRKAKRIDRKSKRLMKFRSEKQLPDDVEVLEEMIHKLKKPSDRERLKKVCAKAASLGSYLGASTGAPLFYEDCDLVQADAMVEAGRKIEPYSMANLREMVLRDLAAQRGSEAFEAGRWKDCAEQMVNALSYSFTNNDQKLLCCSRAAVAMGHYAKSTEEWDTVSNLLEMAGSRNHSMADQLREVQDLVQRRGNLLVPLRRIVENAERAERSGSIQTAISYAKQASAQGSGKGAVIAARLLAKRSSSLEEVQEAKRYAEIALRRCHPDALQTMNYVRSKELPYLGNSLTATKLGNKAVALNEIRRLQKDRDFPTWARILSLMKLLKEQGEQIPQELFDLVQGYEDLYHGMTTSNYWEWNSRALPKYESAIKLGCKAAYYGGGLYLYEMAVYQSYRRILRWYSPDTLKKMPNDSDPVTSGLGDQHYLWAFNDNKLRDYYRKAIEWLEKAAAEFPDNAEILSALSICKEKYSIISKDVLTASHTLHLFTESETRNWKSINNAIVTGTSKPWKSHPFFAFDVYSELIKYVHVDQ